MDDVTDLEAEKRRRLVASIRRDNDARRTELEAEITQHVFRRAIPDRLTRDRAWFAERDARWAAEREQRQHEADDPMRDALENCASAISKLQGQIDGLHERIDASVDQVRKQVREEHRASNDDLADEVAQLRRELAGLVELLVDFNRIAVNGQAKGGSDLINYTTRAH